MAWRRQNLRELLLRRCNRAAIAAEKNRAAASSSLVEGKDIGHGEKSEVGGRKSEVRNGCRNDCAGDWCSDRWRHRRQPLQACLVVPMRQPASRVFLARAPEKSVGRVVARP